MAAAVTLLGSLFDTNSGTHTVTATPAVGDYIVIVWLTTGNVSTNTISDNNSGGAGSYSGYSANKLTNVDGLHIYVRNALITSATSTIFTAATGVSTGGGLAVLKVTGITRVDTAAVRQQNKVQANQAGGGTPTVTFSPAALTTSAIIGAVFNGANPAAMTPRTGYTELLDTGYATPTTGVEIMSLNSGETGTAIAWGSTSATAFGAIAVEIDSTVPSAALTGTITSSTTGGDIVAGGKTIILTLTNDTFITVGNGFSAQNIINGLTSAQSEAHGWNAEVKAKIPTSNVVRTSATVVTITLSAEAAYSITSQETITVTIPSTEVTSTIAIVVSPTFTVTPAAAPTNTGNFLMFT